MPLSFEDPNKLLTIAKNRVENEDEISNHNKKRIEDIKKTDITSSIIIVTIGSIGFFLVSRTTEVSIPKAYYQLINFTNSDKPLASKWGTLNHTLIILSNNTLRSIVTVTALSEPIYPNVRVELILGKYRSYLAPTPINGETQLSGKIKRGDTMILITDLKVTFEGTYLIGSKAISYADEAEEGYGIIYYVSVKDGKIIGITDAEGRTPPSIEVPTIKVG